MFFTVLDGTTPFDNEEKWIGEGVQRVLLVPGHPFVIETIDALLLNGYVLTEVTGYRRCQLKDVTGNEAVSWGVFKESVGVQVLRDMLDDTSDPYISLDRLDRARSEGDIFVATCNLKTGKSPSYEEVVAAMKFAMVNVYISRIGVAAAPPETNVTVIALGPVLQCDLEMKETLQQMKCLQDWIPYTDVARPRGRIVIDADRRYLLFRDHVYNQLKELLENGLRHSLVCGTTE